MFIESILICIYNTYFWTVFCFFKLFYPSHCQREDETAKSSETAISGRRRRRVQDIRVSLDDTHFQIECFSDFQTFLQRDILKKRGETWNTSKGLNEPNPPLPCWTISLKEKKIKSSSKCDTARSIYDVSSRPLLRFDPNQDACRS